jgi:N-acetyl-gamma-glutamyl-phosphate reductase
MSQKYKVGVAGASGFAGGEFLRLALNHPNLEIGTLSAHSNAGQKVAEVHPHLYQLAKREFVATTAAAFADHDVVVLALPHGQSGAIAAELAAASGGSKQILVDLGADHRLVDPVAWEQFYGTPHAGTWTYGLPELLSGVHSQRDDLRHTDRIAVPGCNVTAVTLGLQPGFASGVLDPSDIVAVLVNGYSGAGRAPKPNLIAAGALESATPYAVGGVHRHIPEIIQNLALAADQSLTEPANSTPANFAISFTPTLAPMSRGILAVATARLSQAWQERLEKDSTAGKSETQAELRKVWKDAYRAEPFISLLMPGLWPATRNVMGSNTAAVQVCFDLAAQRVVTVTAIDNLVKGTAGGAIQSLNLALGLPEVTGLEFNGVAP